MSNANSHRQSSSFTTILLFLTVAAIIFFAAKTFLPGRREEAGIASPVVGTVAPKLRFTRLTGDKDLAADSLVGKVTLINYWGTWCPPCRAEFPRLVAATERFRKLETFQFVSVCVPGGDESAEELADDAKGFLAEHHADFPVFADENSEAFSAILRAAGETRGGIPLTVVIDAKGKFAGYWMGYNTGDEEAVASVISTALDETAEEAKAK